MCIMLIIENFVRKNRGYSDDNFRKKKKSKHGRPYQIAGGPGQLAGCHVFEEEVVGH